MIKTHKNKKIKKTFKKHLVKSNDKEKLEAIKVILSKAYNPYSKLDNIKKIIFS